MSQNSDHMEWEREGARTVTVPEAQVRLKQIAGSRPLPRDRIEAALFGYSEEEWQALVEVMSAGITAAFSEGKSLIEVAKCKN